MKAFRWISLVLAIVLLASALIACGEDEEATPTPTPLGSLVMESGTHEIDEELYAADIGTLSAPETRSKPGSRLIELPVIRLRATGQNPAEPVFLLSGGPGDSNIWEHPPVWLLENHDVVMVGYRGVDGSVSLDLPELAEVLKNLQTFSGDSVEAMGNAFSAGIQRLENEGVDLDGYTMVDAVDDMEAAREGFGYETIDLYAKSYGTRLAYIYGLRYPESIHRSFQFAINPPGRFIWDPEMVDAKINYYGNLWRNDPEAVAKSPDIVKTMQYVLDTLPQEWNGMPVMPDRVKFATQFMLFHTDSAAQVFDAYVAAEQDDYSGLAFLSIAVYDTIATTPTWGDYLPKGLTADYDPNRDYEAEIHPPGSIIGSPAMILFAGAKYIEGPGTFIPEEYRQLQFSDVETLLVNGNIDTSTPVENAQELLPYLRNGELVVLSEMGHTHDVDGMQPEAFHHLVATFYREGVADDSMFTYEPMNFTPAMTYQQLAEMVLLAPPQG